MDYIVRRVVHLAGRQPRRGCLSANAVDGSRRGGLANCGIRVNVISPNGHTRMVRMSERFGTHTTPQRMLDPTRTIRPRTVRRTPQAVRADEAASASLTRVIRPRERRNRSGVNWITMR